MHSASRGGAAVRFALFYAASLLPEPHVKLHANATLGRATTDSRGFDYILKRALPGPVAVLPKQRSVACRYLSRRIFRKMAGYLICHALVVWKSVLPFLSACLVFACKPRLAEQPRLALIENAGRLHLA